MKRLEDLLNFESVFTFFDQEKIQCLSLEQYVFELPASTPIFQKGQRCEDLVIPIRGSVDLWQDLNNSEPVKVGTVKKGRSIFLYNFLRDLPSPYSAHANPQESIEVLKVPRAIVLQLLADEPDIGSYLLKVTENHIYRQIRKDFEFAGLEMRTVIGILARAEETTLLPHSLLCHYSHENKYLFYLIEGKFLVQHAGQPQSWLAPLRSWIGWEEFFQGQSSPVTLTAILKSSALKISYSDLHSIFLKNPEDKTKLSQFFRHGLLAPPPLSESQEEVDSIRDLFKDEKGKVKWSWDFPFVAQNEQMDCGPACLSMVSHYFGKELSVQYWRSRLSTNKEGTNLFDLAMTAERNGFISHCLQVESLHDLDRYLLPFVALRKYHYVVVYKVKKRSVIVGDPALGVIEMSLEKFNDGFEQVGLFLKPNSEFEKLPESKSAWIQYLSLFSGLEAELGLAFICSLLAVFLSIGPPLIGQFLLDEVLVQKDLKMIWVLLSASALVILLNEFVKWAESYYQIFLMTKFNFRATSIFVKKMLSLQYKEFANRHVGDFTHRLSEMEKIRTFVTHTLFTVLLNMVNMVFYAAVLCLINLKLAVTVILLIPPIAIIPLLSAKYLSRMYSEIFSGTAEQSSFISDLVKGIVSVKAAGGEFAARNRYEEKILSLIKIKNKFSLTSSFVQSSTATYFRLAQLAILGAAVFLGAQGEMSPGKVISFTVIASQLFQPLLSLIQEWDQFVEMKSIISRLNDIFLAPSEKAPENLSTTPLPVSRNVFKGEIEFKDVWFRYGGEASDWVLKGLSFKIESGQKVAIVGPSGSGKSTIALLLTRMLEVSRGQILIDGQDIRDYDLNFLRKQIGLLHQDNHLFEGTIAENIALSEIDIDEGKLREATRKAGASEIIENKNNGIYHYLPSGGMGFSGGEKQKISIARMFYKGPSIVVLDEATSALDGISEATILQSIHDYLSGQTVINIAHRFSTVRSSTYALVLSGGKVNGFGTISYLAKENALFKELFNLDLETNRRAA